MRFNSTWSARRPAFLAVSGITAALSASLTLGVAAEASERRVVITILGDHYVVAARAIDDLDALEQTVTASRPRAVRLDACGGMADHPQRAAAHRFRNLDLELRMLETDAPACRAAARPGTTPAGTRHGPRPYGIDNAAVDRWWHRSMP